MVRTWLRNLIGARKKPTPIRRQRVRLGLESLEDRCLLNATSLTTLAAPPQGSNALTFNGVNQYVNVPQNSAFEPAGAISIGAWVKVASVVNSNDALVLMPGSYELDCVPNNYFSETVIFSNVTAVVLYAPIPSLNQWHYVSMTDNGSTVSLYVDGALESSAPATGSAINYSGSSNLHLSDPTNPINATMGDVRIYNRGLSASEEATIAANGPQSFSDGITSGLVGAWRLNEGSGTTAYDSSGNGNNGTLVNGPTWISMGPAPTVYGQQQTFTATVTSASGTPTGSVTFYDNTVSPGTALGTANLSLNGSGNDVAQLTTTTVPAGNNTIIAVYSGDSNFSTSTSIGAIDRVAKATPTVTVTGTSQGYNGSPDAATATVTGVNGVAGSTLEGATPVLTYFAGTGVSGTPLSGPPTAAGTYTVFATFPGSADYNSSAASETFTETGLPSGFNDPYGLTAGPDGSLWFINYTPSWSVEIGQVTPTGQIVEHALPSGSSVSNLVAGKNGNMWFTDPGTNRIGTITASGIVEYGLGADVSPSGMVSDGSGNLWFINYTSSWVPQIGEITLSGQVSEFALPAGGSIGSLVVGPNGNVWYTDSGTNKIGTISGGAVTEYALPAGDQDPYSLVAGSNGTLWFTDYTSTWTEQLAQITVGGTASDRALPAGYSYPSSLVAGPGGSLWFIDYTSTWVSTIGEVNSGGISEYSLPSSSSSVGTMAVGPDGNMWFADSGTNSIGAITPSGTIAEFTVPTSNSSPTNVTVGVNGALWFSESGSGKIGMLASGAASSTFTISRSPTTTTLTSSAPGGSNYGQSLTFTAQVASTASGTPSGTVQFFDGGMSLGFGTLDGVAGDDVAMLTTSALMIGSHTITASYSGDSYFATSNDSANPLTQVISQPPSVTTQPSGQSIIFGQNATFTATASGSPAPTVQWQVSTDGGNTFANLSNGGDFSGVTSNTLTVTGATVAMGGDEYRAVFTNSAGSATSNAAALTVGKANTTTTLTSSQGSDALSFNGSSYVTVPASSAFQPSAAITVGVWVNVAAANSHDSYVLLPGSFELDNQGSYFSETLVFSNITAAVLYSPIPSLNQWHYVAMTDNGATVSLYVDGALASSAAATGSAINYYGGYNLYMSYAPDPMVGDMGDVRIYNRALSASEIATIAANGPQTFADGITNGLVGNWRLNEGGGSTAGDSSGYGNNGTLVNNPTWIMVGGASLSVGQSATYTATVQSTGGIPTGYVQFEVDGANYGSSQLLVNGKASISISFATAGTHTVVASYLGDPNFNPSNDLGDPLTQNVLTPPEITVDTTSGPYTGQPYAATAMVTDSNGNTVSGTTTFTYYAAGSTTGSSTAPTSIGSYSVIASFVSSNPNFGNGTSAPVTFAITAPVGETVAPTITLRAQVLPGQQVELWGVMSDDNPAGALVTFSGAVSASTTTNPDGTFSFIASTASLGTVYAVGLDQSQQSTNTASAIIAMTNPALSVAVASAGQNSVTLSGHVSDLDLAGLTVNFSGAASGSVVTDANGNFTYTGTVSSAGTIAVSATDLWGKASNTADVNVTTGTSGVSASITPEITLVAQVLAGHVVQLSGTVMDSQPGGLTVTFSGAASGTATTDSSGNFTFTTTTASLGTVTAVAVDGNGVSTNTASAIIAVTAPTLSMTVTSMTASTVTVSGSLSDIDMAGETVDFSGVAGGSVVTDANGKFSFTANTSAAGELDASVTDEWGLTSNTAADDVPQGVLGVLDFEAVRESRNVWTFEGRVVGANPSNVTITLGGLGSISGITITPASDGTFEITRTLQAGESGTATAQATCTPSGTLSNVALAIVRNTY